MLSLALYHGTPRRRLHLTQTDRRATFSRLSLEGVAFDLFAISAIAVVLVLVMQTRPAFRDHLVLSYDNPVLHAFYTTHFVHESSAHLQNNVGAYLTIVPLTYLISLKIGRHREFRWTFLGVLFVLPPLISLVSYLGLNPVYGAILEVDSQIPGSLGFSALDGAFVGLLMVTTADFLQKESEQEVSMWTLVNALFFAGLAAGLWGVFEYTRRPLALVLVIIPAIYAAWLFSDIGQAVDLRAGLETDGWLADPVTAGLLVGGVGVSVVGVQGLLGYPWFVGGTNTLSHFTGLLAGIGQAKVMIYNRKN